METEKGQQKSNKDLTIAATIIWVLVGVVVGAAMTAGTISEVAQRTGAVPVICNFTIGSLVNSQPVTGTQAVQEPGPTPIDTFHPADMNEFTQCLTSKGLTFYGAYWCPHCKNMEQLFGNGMANINYVECDLGNNTMSPACQQQGITGFPTFKVGSTTLTGEQTLTQLSQATGCT